MQVVIRHGSLFEGDAKGACAKIESRVTLPLSIATGTGEQTTLTAEIITFCGKEFERCEHFAVYWEPRPHTVPLVRVHSACITGEVLGSRRCDCGPQLKYAMSLISVQGGALIYLDQEGRGIGLRSKILAYKLQDCGMDTFMANRTLGFPDDPRTFTPAAQMMLALGLKRVRLLTNNLEKARQLSAFGVDIDEVLPTPLFRTPENTAYIAAKQAAGHHFGTE